MAARKPYVATNSNNFPLWNVQLEIFESISEGVAVFSGTVIINGLLWNFPHSKRA